VNYFHELQMALGQIDPSPLLDFITTCEGTLWLAGNGGSASTAQHWACDLSKAAGRRVQALGSNPAVLTAWANDAGYEHALRLEFLRLYQPKDRLITISCSGTSQNIEQVMSEAIFRDIPVAIVTGAKWESPYRDDIPVMVVNVPHTHYGIIEDCHLAIGHWLTEALCSR
jgi:D-sedoheptulose 7-phosphate isomerase